MLFLRFLALHALSLALEHVGVHLFPLGCSIAILTKIYIALFRLALISQTLTFVCAVLFVSSSTPAAKICTNRLSWKRLEMRRDLEAIGPR
jgi:hypothetical protein